MMHTVGAAGSVSGRAEEGALAIWDKSNERSVRKHKRGYSIRRDNRRLRKGCLLRHKALSSSDKTTDGPTTSTSEASNVVRRKIG
jgi:hypothetical protein